MKINRIIPYMAILLLACTSCKNKDGEKQENATIEQQQEAVVEVDTIRLKRQTFQKQLLCNGKLTATRKADLQCNNVGDILQKVAVVNGQYVPKGALLCVSDMRNKQADLEKAKHDMEKAKVELQDKLIGLGYDIDISKVPADVLHKAEIVSGYYSAKFQLLAAQKKLAECELRAPFAGRIANLEARAYQTGGKFATLIDDSSFEVEFQILEAELAFVKRSKKVMVTPYTGGQETYVGTVKGINPTVDSKSMVKVMASVKNSSSKLIDGMNVKVIVENSVPNMFVVPKEAVVERDGYHVIFTYNKETRRAVWTYVDIVFSNLNSYAITGNAKKETEIKEGDVVIVSGNLNLADDTEVKAN